MCSSTAAVWTLARRNFWVISGGAITGLRYVLQNKEKIQSKNFMISVSVHRFKMKMQIALVFDSMTL